MATKKFLVSTSGNGLLADLGYEDNCYIAKGAVVSTSDIVAIRGQGSGHLLEVYGSLVAEWASVKLGDSYVYDAAQRLVVGKSGFVTNTADEYDGQMIKLRGSGSSVQNDGIIRAKMGTALALGGSDDNQTSVVKNTGLIESNYHYYAIFHNSYGSTGHDALVIENSGTIIGKIHGSRQVDTIRNTGSISGNIELVSGDDVFDTRGGSFSGAVIAGGGRDKLYGSAGKDVFYGGSSADKLYAYDGDDALYGDTGDDYISGGNGKDRITGGAGKDELRGGAGADTFIFTIVGESTVTEIRRDLILDFSQSQKDKIDLSAIDAKINTGPDDVFTFIGKSSYSDKPGELRYKNEGGFTKIYGDVDGDGASEFAIWLDGVYTLKASDFIL